LLRDGGKCQICERRVYAKSKIEKKILFMTFKHPLRRGTNIDHVVPFSYGGKGILENGRVTCERCNKKRGNKIDRACLEQVRKEGKKIYLGKKVPKFKYERKHYG